jgi:hypothetical protein
VHKQEICESWTEARRDALADGVTPAEALRRRASENRAVARSPKGSGGHKAALTGTLGACRYGHRLPKGLCLHLHKPSPEYELIPPSSRCPHWLGKGEGVRDQFRAGCKPTLMNTPL